MKRQLVMAAAALMATAANANVCGTDYQIFNPTTNGLDFVTVQSSETLKPCIMNTGLFFNYAVNSLTYSQTLNANFPSGQKRKDRTLGMDASAGIGLTKNWDFGINVPFVLDQSVQDDYYVSSFGNDGATEIKFNTKYRLLGDDGRGLAFVFSLNKNFVSDNPFTGRNAGPTLNYELAVDTTLGGQWAVGANIGYRDRNPGTPIERQPFIPLEDQFIYSLAGSYLIAQLDTKVIAELYGSKAARPMNIDSDRSMNSLEGLLGFKYDASPSLALHMGASHALDASMGGADWRAYVGMNWAFEVCKTASLEPVVVAPPAEPNSPEQPSSPEVLALRIRFSWNADQPDERELSSLDDQFKAVFGKGFDSILVEGHTDSVGDPNYNLSLSQRRAKSVRDYLVKKYALPADKVEALGFGPVRPVADNGNFQGRQQNRRVELKIWPKSRK